MKFPLERPNHTDLSRRELLRTLGLTAAGVGIGAGGFMIFDSGKEGSIEDRESGDFSFEKEVIGYQSFINLRHDQVLFVDEDNVPIGSPVDFEDIVAPKQRKDGTVIDAYLYSAGSADENGVLRDVPTLEWRQQVAKKLKEEFPEREIVGDYNVVRIFQSALRYADEPQLQAAIAEGDVATYADIIDHFAEKSVVGSERSSRYEYVHEAIAFNEAVPQVVQEALREVVPGICAQESKFHNGLTSDVGAFGIFQFMPDIWDAYGRKPEEITSLKIQVEVAGELLSDIYREFLHHCDTDALVQIRSLFTDEEAFQVDFLVPAIINSYQAGSARMADVVNLFVRDQFEAHTHLSGKDVFISMVDHAAATSAGKLGAYKDHSRAYVPKVYAHALSIHNRLA